MNNCNEETSPSRILALQPAVTLEEPNTTELEDNEAAVSHLPSHNSHQSLRYVEEGATHKRDVKFNLRKLSILVWKGAKISLVYSSWHGIPFFVNSTKSKIKMVSWLIALVTAFALMFYSVTAVSTKFTSGRTYFSTSHYFPKELPFPAFTICNINPFKISAVLSNNLPLVQANLFLLYIRARNRIPLPKSFFNSFVQHYDTISGKNNTFFRDLGHKIDDQLLTCTFDGKKCSIDNFTARVTSDGLCYTFNPNGDFTPYYTGKHGYRYGLIVRINIEQYEYFSFLIGSAGLNAFVHDHDHFPYIGTHRRLLLSPGQVTLLSVSMTQYRRLSPPRESCLIECDTRLAIKTCGCKAEYMPGNEITCTLNQTLYCLLPHRETFQPKLCDCPVPCSNTVYNAQLSYSSYPASHLSQTYNNSYFIQSGVVPVPDYVVSNYTDANGMVISYLTSNVTVSELRANYMKLAVYYDALEFTHVREELQYTLVRFFADFTGFIGFFIGAGFLSFFEVMELIYSTVKPPKQHS